VSLLTGHARKRHQASGTETKFDRAGEGTSRPAISQALSHGYRDAVAIIQSMNISLGLDAVRE